MPLGIIQLTPERQHLSCGDDDALLKVGSYYDIGIEKRRPPRHDERSLGERFCPRTMVVKGRELFAKLLSLWLV